MAGSATILDADFDSEPEEAPVVLAAKNSINLQETRIPHHPPCIFAYCIHYEGSYSNCIEVDKRSLA